MVERSLCMREARGSIPRISNFSQNSIWRKLRLYKEKNKPILLIFELIARATNY